MVVVEATATSAVMTAAAMAGVKRQQSTSDRSVEGGRWTRAQRRMKTNNESAWPMMRAVTKRAARAMAMLTRVTGERLRRW
jgi:hypothetical protein